MDPRLKAFERLLTIMDELRDKCPWDKKQTWDTLRTLTIEECFELSDALLDKDVQEVKKELGDLMMHLVFYAKIADEKKEFDITDVLNSVCDKLIYRHPHIYSDAVAETEEEVSQNWESLKLKEGNESVLSGVPRSLPALVKAQRIQEKVRGVGFDWDNKEEVYQKVEEELHELAFEVQKNDSERMEAEFGDVLFSLINYGRFLQINPDDALEKTNKKFVKRFQMMEELIRANDLNITELKLDEMDVFWNQAKKIENL